MAKFLHNHSSDASVGDELPPAKVFSRTRRPMLSLEAMAQRALIHYAPRGEQPEFWTPLMDRLEDRTGRKIKNRHEFERELNISAFWFGLEEILDEGPTPKETRIIYEEMVQHFDAFRSEFESLLECSLWRPCPTGPLLKALPIEDRYADNDLTEAINNFTEDLDRLERVLHKALDYAHNLADEDKRGGARKKFALNLVVNHLAKTYSEQIDHRAGTSREVEDGGPFVAFIRDFLDLVEPGKDRKSLAQTIHGILKSNPRFPAG